MLEPNIKTYIEHLIAAYPKIKSVWLFGSRANGTARSNSDWDLLVFGSQNILKALRADSRFHQELVDLLVLYNGKDFKKPWGEKPKSGSLRGWDWKETDLNSATYRATKTIYDKDRKEEFNVKVLQCKAVRVYPWASSLITVPSTGPRSRWRGSSAG